MVYYVADGGKGRKTNNSDMDLTQRSCSDLDKSH